MNIPATLSLALDGGQVGVLVIVSWQLGRLISAIQYHDTRLNKLEKKA